MTASLSNGFRDTPLGPLPEDWEVVRLGDLSDLGVLVLQNGFPCGNHNDQGIGVPHLRPMNISNDGRIALDTVKFIQTKEDISRYVLKIGDVIFNNTNSEELVGKTAYWDKEGNYVLSNHMTILRVLQRDVIEPFYLSCFLYKEWLAGYFLTVCRRHVNQASVSLERLKQIFIPLPPLPEQRAIAHVLRTIQRAIEATERVIAAARELKKSLMRHLFTYGPVPPAEAESVPLQETEIGMVPKHYKLGALGDALRQTQYGISKRGQASGCYPILRMNNLEDGHVAANDLQYVDLSPEEFEKFRVHPGDLLFNRTNSYDLVGKTAIFDLDEEVVFASYLIRVVPDPNKLDPRFLNYFLNADSTQRRLKSLATRGVSQANISATKLKSFVMLFPPLPEQQRIAQMLAAVDAKIRAEEGRKAALQGLFKSALHHLMTGKVRVAPMETEE